MPARDAGRHADLVIASVVEIAPRLGGLAARRRIPARRRGGERSRRHRLTVDRSTVLIVGMRSVEQDDGVSFPGDDRHDVGVQKVLGQLPELEAAIMRFRFGLDGGPLHTLAETGVQFGVSRDAVRKIETVTLAKLSTAKGPEPPGTTQNDA